MRVLGVEFGNPEFFALVEVLKRFALLDDFDGEIFSAVNANRLTD